jgi:mannose-6-phosphate isomerase
MSVERLVTHVVEKPWGRERLWPGFEQFERGAKIGEIWFQSARDEEADLLVKYLFTSEKLSIQVHPNDAQAQARGFPRGKDEAWLILAAEPDSTIALGPKTPLTKEGFRAAIRDGSIADLLDWRPVKAGDFIYSPAGTVHAIGAGLTLIEVQQNLDLTYRLYDYGRPRELHIEDGATVSSLDPFEEPPAPSAQGVLANGPKFVVERLTGDRSVELGTSSAMLVPVSGTGSVNGHAIAAGECWQVSGSIDLRVSPGGVALLAYSDSRVL